MNKQSPAWLRAASISFWALFVCSFVEGAHADPQPPMFCDSEHGNNVANNCVYGPLDSDYQRLIVALLQKAVADFNISYPPTPTHSAASLFGSVTYYSFDWGVVAYQGTVYYNNNSTACGDVSQGYPACVTYEIHDTVGAQAFAYCPGEGIGAAPTPPGAFIWTCHATLVIVPRVSNPPPSCPSDPPKGNPIYPLRGVKREFMDTGIRLGALNLTFTYDSTALVPRAPANLDIMSGTQLAGGVLGSMWSTNLHRRIGTTSVSQGSGINPGAAQVSRGNGVIVSLSGDSGGQYTPEANIADRLVGIAGGGYRYYDASANAQETYNTSGLLTNITWATGQSIALVYSDTSTPGTVAPAPNYLIQATDNAGRSVSFNYVARTGPPGEAQIKTITDPKGQVTTLAYDASGNLGSVTWPDTKVRTFLYENAYGALTGIADELTVRYATFGYDINWRAVSTEYAGGVAHYSSSYTTPPSILITEQYDGTANAVYHFYDWALPVGTVVTGPTGASSNWSASTLLTKNYLTGQSQPAGSGCAASSSAIGYDANGNVVSADDFNGSRACYVSDLSRNLETTRVEGLANTAACSSVTAANATLPAGSRKVSTQWHPDWRLEAKRAEPAKLTTSVYNGQPDPFNGNAIASCAPGAAVLPDGKPIAVLCKQVEQATADANGHLGLAGTLDTSVPNRVSSWTYNAFGQVLTAKGPRTDVNDTTTYAYYADTTVDHTLGDLQSMTNAAGKVSTYDKYNKVGQVLQSTDPNGVVTVNTYDLRQRLLSATVGTEATSYTYDPVGQLITTTLPNGATITNTYDAAHRLIQVADAAGNKVIYTLDASGNRIVEQVKDAGGTLVRNITRSYDALNRLQSSTGAAR